MVSVGAVVTAFASILVELSGASPSTAAIFRCVYALPLLGALAVRERAPIGDNPGPGRCRLWLAGAFLGADLILWHHSIEDVGAGLATMLVNVQVVIVPLVAWALWRERPNRGVLVAVPVAALGVVLISGAFGGVYGSRPVLGSALGILAGVAYVGFLLILRASPGVRHRVAGSLFDVTLGAAVFCVAVGLVLGEADLVPAWPSAGWLALLAVSTQVFAWLMITSAVPHLRTATTSLVLVVQPACTVLFAAIILNEIPSAAQLVGVFVVLACPVSLLGSRSGRTVRPTP
jgi:drug/metabolite transporter (DMT)-like permease